MLRGTAGTFLALSAVTITRAATVDLEPACFIPQSRRDHPRIEPKLVPELTFVAGAMEIRDGASGREG